LRAPRPDWAVDLADFERLVPAGSEALSAGDWSRAMTSREEELALCKGQVLDLRRGVRSGGYSMT